MTARTYSPLHDKWHPRVEGQIKDCMNKHPDWFAHIPKGEIYWFVNSLAKRIVGEIVADEKLVAMPNVMTPNCEQSAGNGVGI